MVVDVFKLFDQVCPTHALLDSSPVRRFVSPYWSYPLNEDNPLRCLQVPGTQRVPTPKKYGQSCVIGKLSLNYNLFGVTGTWSFPYESLAGISLQARLGFDGDEPNIAVSTMHALHSRLTAGDSDLQYGEHI
ncbi:hypothetical protein TNCV_3870091 [Trichonephila clavipes]|nr:hypothetical protein TNCV_3870091 [Trichonephila clavipes]